MQLIYKTEKISATHRINCYKLVVSHASFLLSIVSLNNAPITLCSKFELFFNNLLGIAFLPEFGCAEYNAIVRLSLSRHNSEIFENIYS